MKESIKRIEIDGIRHYQIKQGSKIIGTFPSVTAILGQTSDKSGIEKWKAKVGEEEANRISTNSMNRGTVMHRLIELYKPLQGSKEEKLEKLLKLMKTDKEIIDFDQTYIDQGLEFFMKFYNNSSHFFDRVKTVLAAEKFLWCVKGGGYAGTVDNVSELMDDTIAVIDYKNSRKPKEERWIQDYFIQASAYVIAFWERTSIRPKYVEIWIANELDACPQIFALTESDIKIYFKMFQERLKAFKQLS